MLKLYALLGIIQDYGLVEIWKEVYEEAVKEGFKPNDRLGKTYQHVLEHNELKEN